MPIIITNIESSIHYQRRGELQFLKMEASFIAFDYFKRKQFTNQADQHSLLWYIIWTETKIPDKLRVEKWKFITYKRFGTPKMSFLTI